MGRYDLTDGHRLSHIGLCLAGSPFRGEPDAGHHAGHGRAIPKGCGDSAHHKQMERTDGIKSPAPTSGAG